MPHNLTVTDTEIKVNGTTVAKLIDRDTNAEAYGLLLDALFQDLLRKDEAVYLALSIMGATREGVRTSEVATFLSMDRSNCTKALERLLEHDRIQVVGSTEWSEDSKGRPSRLWKIV